MAGSDVGYHLSLIKIILKFGVSTTDPWNHAGVPNIYPPGYHLLNAFVHILSGDSLIDVLKITGFMISLFTFLNIYSLTNELTNDKFASFVSSFLAVFSSIMFIQLQNALFGQLFGLYVFSLSLLMLVIYLKGNKKFLILFSLAMSLLALTHVDFFFKSILIYSGVFLFHIFYKKDLKILIDILLICGILLLLAGPWYFQLKDALIFLSKRRGSFADIWFGNVSDFYVIGYSVFLIATVGFFYISKELNEIPKLFFVMLIIGFIITNAYNLLGISGMRENFSLPFLAIPLFTISGYGIFKFYKSVEVLDYRIVFFAIIFLLLYYHYFNGIKGINHFIPYVSEEEYTAITKLKSILQNYNTTVLSDEMYTGFRYWVLGTIENKLISDGWEPNAVDKFKTIENAKRVFDPKSSIEEIYSSIEEEEIGLIILHKNNKNYENLISLFKKEYENQEVVILSTYLIGD